MMNSAEFDLSVPSGPVPQRVISLVPSVTETLFDLGVGDRVIGVTDYCTRPPQTAALPRLGGTKNPDLKEIFDLRPDLVIMNWEENRRQDAIWLREKGLRVWVTGPTTVQAAIDLMWEIMNVFEYAQMTERVLTIEQAYEQTLRFMTADGDPVRTFVPIWRDPWMTFNQFTYMHDLLWTCGALNVFADRERQYPLAVDVGEVEPSGDADPRYDDLDTRYPRLALDEIIAAQPALILLPNEPYAFSEVDRFDLLRLDIPAARSQQIHLIDGDLLTWHGTRLAYALQEIPPLIAGARTTT